MLKAKRFILSLVEEIRYRITWPTYSRLQRSAILVLFVSFVFALLIGLIDWSFKQFFFWFYSIF